MTWNGTGNFNLTDGAVSGRDIHVARLAGGGSGTTLDAPGLDAIMNDVANGMEQCLTRNGETGGLTAPFDANGQRIVSLGQPIAAGNGLRWETPTAWNMNPSGSGTMILSGVSTNIQKFVQVGAFVFFEADFTCTLSGTASNTINIVAPIARPSDMFSSRASGGGYIADSSARGCFWYLQTTVIGITPYTGGNFGLGSGIRVVISGSYRVTA